MSHPLEQETSSSETIQNLHKLVDEQEDRIISQATKIQNLINRLNCLERTLLGMESSSQPKPGESSSSSSDGLASSAKLSEGDVLYVKGNMFRVICGGHDYETNGVWCIRYVDEKEK